MVEPTAGEILVAGQPLPVGEPASSLERGVATIYQELDLVDDLTVAQSVYLGHEVKNGLFLDRAEMRRGAEALLERLGHPAIRPGERISALRPAAKQIVSIARALSHDLRLLIMDEPSAILDDGEIETLFEVVRPADRGRGRRRLHHPPTRRDPPDRRPGHGPDGRSHGRNRPARRRPRPKSWSS